MTSEPSDDDGLARIELRNVSLRLRVFGDSVPSIKESAMNRLLRRRVRENREFWLYRDLDLRIDHGERVGIIGLNGAGKSTLLKIICGIYNPTLGKVSVRGRIAPLIELGAGFNPELSGLENIMLNGVLLGWPPDEMRAKVDGILEFAELKDSAGMPLKYYSTGMLMRLAFAVASDVDPEVLVIDELFAGGDARFVERARTRMEHLFDSSHIVVMVSHRLELVQAMCTRVVWIDKGQILEDGPTDEVIDHYTTRLGVENPTTTAAWTRGG
jgi:ABC-type polysaccharide/polyol phosphate transport system ATPase subunit